MSQKNIPMVDGSCSSGDLMKKLYPRVHTDHATGIESWTQSEPFMKKGSFSLYHAYILENDEEIVLLTTTGNWSYHAHHKEDPRRVIANALRAMKAQKRYNKLYRFWHIPLIMLHLVIWKPLFDRKIAIEAGNCTAGTDKWFKDHGYQFKEYVTWWQMLRHLFGSRSRMVAWYVWDKHRTKV